MIRIVVLILLAVVISVTCTESPFNPINLRPVPDYVGLGSCAYRADAPDSVSAGYEGRIKFHFRLHGLTDSNPPKHLVCLVQVTEEIFGCLGFTIDEEVHVAAGLIDIRHKGIGMFDPCLTALGPAVANEGFELPIGTYMLRFQNGRQVDDYELIADGETVTISPMGATSFTIYDPPECCGDSVSVAGDNYLQ